MAFTLGQLLIATLRSLGQLNDYTATGGSTTTAVLPDIPDAADDEYKGGTAFVVYVSTGLAPQFEYSRISAYNASTFTVTFAALSAAVASGHRIGIAQSFYPMETAIACANDGLRMLGDVPDVDVVTLTSDNQVTEYTWAVDWKRKPPTKIQVQTSDGTVALDNEWRDVQDWYAVPAAPGTAGKIIFREKLMETGKAIKVWYEAPHPQLTASTSVISEFINPELAIAATAEKLLEWQARRTQGNDPFLLQTLNDAKATTERMRQMYPMWKPKRRNMPFILPKANI